LNPFIHRFPPISRVFHEPTPMPPHPRLALPNTL
jgi:hypothetical protein